MFGRKKFSRGAVLLVPSPFSAPLPESPILPAQGFHGVTLAQKAASTDLMPPEFFSRKPLLLHFHAAACFRRHRGRHSSSLSNPCRRRALNDLVVTSSLDSVFFAMTNEIAPRAAFQSGGPRTSPSGPLKSVTEETGVTVSGEIPGLLTLLSSLGFQKRQHHQGL